MSTAQAVAAKADGSIWQDHCEDHGVDAPGLCIVSSKAAITVILLQDAFFSAMILIILEVVSQDFRVSLMCSSPSFSPFSKQE